MGKRLSILGLYLCRMRKTLLFGIIAIPVVGALVYFAGGAYEGALWEAVFPGDADMLYSIMFTSVIAGCVNQAASENPKKNSKSEYLMRRLAVTEKRLFFNCWAALSIVMTVLYLFCSLTLSLTAYLNSLREGFVYGAQGIFTQIAAGSFVASMTIYMGPVSIAKWLTVIVTAGLIGAYARMSAVRGRKIVFTTVCLWIMCIITNVVVPDPVMILIFIFDGMVFAITLTCALRRLKKPWLIEGASEKRRQSNATV